MRETASERLVRPASRDIAMEAMRRIRARLREVGAAPEAEFEFEPEWEQEGRQWPQGTLSGREWVPHLVSDLEAAETAFARCR